MRSAASWSGEPEYNTRLAPFFPPLERIILTEAAGKLLRRGASRLACFRRSRRDWAPRLLRDLALVTIYRSISGDRRQALSHSLRQNSNSDHYRGGAYSSCGNYASAFDKRDAEGWRQRLGR